MSTLDMLDLIRSRRSRRKFLDKNVPDDMIEKLMDAARHAPFGGPPIPDCQLCEFIVIKDSKIKEKLTLGYKESAFIAKAPVLIAVCADTSRDKEYKDYDITAALAVENLLLAAHALGLSAVFTTTYTNHINEQHKRDRAEMCKLLGLPPHIRLIAIIPVGYPDPAEKVENKKLRPLKELVHREKW